MDDKVSKRAASLEVSMASPLPASSMNGKKQPPSRAGRRLESPMADEVSKPAAPLEVSMDKEPSSSPLLASSMDGEKQQPPPPLAGVVVVDVDAELSPPSSPASTASSAASMDKNDKPPVLVLVCLWALLNAVIFTGYAIDELISNRHPCTTSTWFSRCVELTEAAAAEAFALWRGLLWCGAPQAAAAALALVLAARGRSPGGRWGAWALALVALAATAAGHYMEGRVDRIFHAAAPGDAYIALDVAMGFGLVLIDLICFLCLLFLGDGGDDE